MTDADRHARVSDLLDTLGDADDETRAAALAAEPDEEVRQSAQRLLASMEQTGPLDRPMSTRQTAETPVGREIGPWRLAEVIGQGGMGVVYRAERADGAFERDVALKRLRPGPDTAGLASRLRSERQILARLEHPGIARLYDGGVDEEGVPYLAMELVHGRPITDHADARGLSVRERVRLAAEVCDAVAFAHQRLVVHRDLKPSNVLVDEEGHAKLLDFGIAKLLDPEASDLLTRTQAALTPAYAAPEQVSGREVTTATDVYALGVLLYELLAGRRPYDLSASTAAQAERIISEEVPPTPSSVAPPDRQRALRGDLDTVVLKALEKEPTRRYATAQALADDLRRHLDGLAVEARPATAAYRLGRFVRRHRVLAGATVAVLLAVVGGAGVALWQAREARAERRTAERVNAFVTTMLASANPYEGGARDVTVAEVADAAAARLDALVGEPETEAGIRLALGSTYRGIGEYEKADAQLRRALSLREAVYGPRHPETAEALTALGALALDRSSYPEADSLLVLALAIRTRHPGEHRADYAVSLSVRGQVALYLGELDEAERQLREAIGILRAHPAPVPPDVTDAIQNARYALGLTLHEAGDYAAADSVLTPLVDEMREAEGRPPAYLGSALGILAWNHDFLGNRDRIEPLLQEAIAFREERFGPEHPETGYALNDLAYYYQFFEDDVPKAEATYRRALAIFRGAHGDDYAAVPSVLNNLGSLFRESGRAREAIPLLVEAVEIQRELLGPEHVDTSYPLMNLGRTYVTLGQPSRAEAPLREALRLRIQSDGEVHRRVGAAQEALASALLAAGRRAEALALYREATGTLREALGPDHGDVAEVELMLAEALLDGGARGEAARLVTHGAPILRETYPDGNAHTERADRLESRLGL